MVAVSKAPKRIRKMMIEVCLSSVQCTGPASVSVTAVSGRAWCRWLRLRVWLRCDETRLLGSAHTRRGRHLPPHLQGVTSPGHKHREAQQDRISGFGIQERPQRREAIAVCSVWAKIESLPCRGRRTLISHHDWWKIFSHSLWMMMGFRVIVIWKKMLHLSCSKKRETFKMYALKHQKAPLPSNCHTRIQVQFPSPTKSQKEGFWLQCILRLSKVTLLLFLYRAIFEGVMTITNMGAFFWDIIYVLFSFSFECKYQRKSVSGMCEFFQKVDRMKNIQEFQIFWKLFTVIIFLWW